MSQLELDPRLFRQFCDMVYEHAGIRLKPGKESLLKARVGKRLKALGLATLGQYFQVLKEDQGGEELRQFLDVISTNYTSFFREPAHFELLTQKLKSWAAQGRHRFRLWSAAASTGEEPYSMAITAMEALEGFSTDLQILGTDISVRALHVAETARYSERALEAMGRAQRARGFFRRRGDDDRCYEVRPAVRLLVTLRRLNLSAPPFPMHGPLDVVFCRNVMIYFDNRVRQALLSEIERLLAPDGILCIGHAETLTGLRTQLRLVRPSVYVRGADAGASYAQRESR